MQRPPDNTQHSQETDILVQAPGEIRTYSPCQRAVTDPRTRPCGQWDRLTAICLQLYESSPQPYLIYFLRSTLLLPSAVHLDLPSLFISYPH